jgi:metal-dependent amidase/aminoacylase/carboxypeptidase family protein
VGSGDKVIALRADIDALPIEEATGCRFARKMKA